MLTTLLNIIHIGACAVLMFVVLLQQGKGGGLGAAFGGGAAAQVFGGRGAGNILTKATAICATIFMLTSVSLAYLSSSGDRALKMRAIQESSKKTEEKTPMAKPTDKATPETKPGDTPPAPETKPGDTPPAPPPSTP